jgi:formate dehydrogenase iron-sulfur subunit
MNGTTIELGDPGGSSTWGGESRERVGFFTDTSVCIGCKACEVACKEWNHVPADNLGFSGDSYDNSGGLGGDRWRHVAFIEQQVEVAGVSSAAPDSWVEEARKQELVEAGLETHADDEGFRWLMSSDVCKHCTDAGCLDGCPTGSIFRTEFGTVVVQEDICNGCGYCVTACPYGVLDRRSDDGRVWKCTLCYDRLQDDMEPACAQACPTDSIQFGPVDELLERAEGRVAQLRERGVGEARLYGDGPSRGVGGTGAFFLLLDDPETYGLPPDPVVPARHLGEAWGAAGVAALALGAGVLAAFVGRRA